MPRFVVSVEENEATEVGGIRVKAIVLRGRGRRVRVVIDVPPGWPARMTKQSAIIHERPPDRNSHYGQ